MSQKSQHPRIVKLPTIFAIALGWALASISHAAERRPNVIVVMADDISARDSRSTAPASVP